MLSGDNGILQKATTAKENTNSAQIKERIQLAYHSALVVGQGNYTKKSLEDELEKEFTTDYSVDDSDNDNWILTAKGQSVTIPAGKEDDEKITIKARETNLKEVSDLSQFYGETTNYTSVSNVQWQLFYDDEQYIYLIASDYVPIDTLPSELLKENQAQGEVKYKAWFGSYSNSTFTGTIIESTPWSNGADSSTITENTQTNIFLKWVNSSVATTRDNPNMKAVAYMMDTNKWSNFVGRAKGATAIGGPTIEMFALSYNAKHDTKIGTYDTIDSTTANSYGYNVKIGNGPWVPAYATGLEASSDNMWTKTRDADSRAYGYWIASPNSANYTTVCCMFNGGALNANDFVNTNYGFRPLISIPKSSLK